MSTTQSTPKASKHFSSSVLLWVRSDQPRQTSMDYWKGPHSGIIANTPGLDEYRQIHLAEINPGMWPTTGRVETQIPIDRKIDGIAEVTFESALSPLAGRKQTALAYEDEVNVFRRTLLYAGPPNSSRWYDVAPGERAGSRAILYLRRRQGVGSIAFHKFVKKTLVPALVGAAPLKELRTQVFLPWSEKLWDTPNVAHDNPDDQHLHASVILGFADQAARDDFFAGTDIAHVTEAVVPFASAIHAYDVTAALTYVRNGRSSPTSRSSAWRKLLWSSENDAGHAGLSRRDAPCMPHSANTSGGHHDPRHPADRAARAEQAAEARADHRRRSGAVHAAWGR